MTCLQVCWFFILHDRVCCSSSLFNLSVLSLYSSASGLLFGSFLWLLFLYYSFHFGHVLFPEFVSSIRSLAFHWASLRWLLWNLCQAIHRSPFLWSVIGALLVSFGGVLFAWFFLIHVAYISVSACEGAHPFSSLYRLV